MSYTSYYQTTLQHHIHKFYTCNGFPCQIFFYAYHLINFYLDTFYKKITWTPNYGAYRICSWVLRCQQVSYCISFYSSKTRWQTSDYHICDFNLHLMYHVSNYESCCNTFIQRKQILWNMDSDMGYELPNGITLSVILLWTIGKINI